jgi:hypothetical protein
MYIVGEEKPDGKANAQANALLNGRLTSRLGRLQLKVCGEDHRVIQHRGQVGSGTHVGARPQRGADRDAIAVQWTMASQRHEDPGTHPLRSVPPLFPA